MSKRDFADKIIKGLKRHEKGLSLDHRLMHPYREWFLGILAIILILAGGLVWALRLHAQFSDTSNLHGTDKTESLIYKADLVDNAIKDIASRISNYRTLKAKLENSKVVLPPIIEPEVEVVSEEAVSGEVELIPVSEPVSDSPLLGN